MWRSHSLSSWKAIGVLEFFESFYEFLVSEKTGATTERNFKSRSERIFLPLTPSAQRRLPEQEHVLNINIFSHHRVVFPRLLVERISFIAFFSGGVPRARHQHFSFSR